MNWSRLLFAISPIVIGCYGQNDPERVVVPGQPRMLVLESPPTPILRYEPCALRVCLRNTENQLIETTIALGRLDQPGIILSLVCPKGNSIQWKRDWEPVDTPFLPSRKLRAGQTVCHSFDCHWHEKCPAFDQAGKYRLDAEWKGTAPYAANATCVVTVEEGNQRDRECLEYVLSEDLQHYLPIGSFSFRRENQRTGQEALDAVFRVVERFPETRYAAHFLANLLYELEAGSGTDQFRAKTLAFAKQHIRQHPHPRTLYYYATIIGERLPLEAKALLGKANALKPDQVFEGRIRSKFNELSKDEQ